MADYSKYYIVRKKAVPEVLLKVIEAKRLLDSGKVESVQEATDIIGISRSSFYKYKDDIFPFRDHTGKTTITFVLQVEDEPGILSRVLNKIADCNANVLTIHQTIPMNGMATLTLSVELRETSGDVPDMIAQIEHLAGIHYFKILAQA